MQRLKLKFFATCEGRLGASTPHDYTESVDIISVVCYYKLIGNLRECLHCYHKNNEQKTEINCVRSNVFN